MEQGERPCVGLVRGGPDEVGGFDEPLVDAEVFDDVPTAGQLVEDLCGGRGVDGEAWGDDHRGSAAQPDRLVHRHG